MQQLMVTVFDIVMSVYYQLINRISPINLIGANEKREETWLTVLNYQQQNITIDKWINIILARWFRQKGIMEEFIDHIKKFSQKAENSLRI